MNIRKMMISLSVLLVAGSSAAFIYLSMNSGDDGNQSLIDNAIRYDQEQREWDAAAAALTAENSIKTFNSGNSSSVQDEYPGGERLINPAGFVENAERIGHNEDIKAALNYKILLTAAPTDTLLLKFTAYSEKSAAISVSMEGSSYFSYYYTGPDITEYYIPITNCNRIYYMSITLLSPWQDVYVGDLELVNYGSSYKTADFKNGSYNISQWDDIVMPEEGIGLGPSRAVITDDNYLYSISRDVLTIAEYRDGEASAIGSVSGIGQSRDLAFGNGGSTVIVSSRENGLYIVDVSNPYAPYILSRYDTLEFVSGIYVQGDYLFACSRYFGIEIIDISDPSNPVNRSVVSSPDGDVDQMDCFVSDGYLYVGIWDKRIVEIYDVNDVTDPRYMSTAFLEGHVCGCFVENKILYAATGYHSRNAKTAPGDPGYGTGNGFEIFDVSDPANPVWLSGVRTDGAYYYSGNDTWKIAVAGGYAYLTNTYNGVFIYDVTDPAAPSRVSRISVRIEPDSDRYTAPKLGNDYVFPFDTTKYMQDPVLGVSLSDGRVFMACVGTDVHVFESDYVDRPNVGSGNSLSASGDFWGNVKIEAPGYSSRTYRGEGSVYAAKIRDNYIFAACGSDGIRILDMDMNPVFQYQTAAPVKDIEIFGDYLYSAESEGGLGVYRIDDGVSLTRIGSFNVPAYNRTFSSIKLTPDGAYVVIQAGWTRIIIVDVRNPFNPVDMEELGTINPDPMYYRNLCIGLVKDKYIGVSFSMKMRWYGQDENGYPEVIAETDSIAGQSNGVAACGDYAVAVCNGGYVYFEPDKITKSEDLNNLPVISVEDVNLTGKCSINGNLMVVSTEYNGDVTILDISDIDAPVLLTQFTIPTNCDVAYISKDCILIPMRRGGLLKLTPENARYE